MIQEPNGKNILGFECKATDVETIYRMVGATFEQGFINGVTQEVVQPGEIFILTSIELLMNTSIYDFHFRGIGKYGDIFESELILPPAEKITTVIPYFKIADDRLAIKTPYTMHSGNSVVWSEPAELYEKMFSNIFDFRIKNNELLIACEDMSAESLEVAVYVGLRNLIFSDIEKIKRMST